MQEMGHKLEQLLPTNLTLFTADKKSPVIISVDCEDGGTATTMDLLYIVLTPWYWDGVLQRQFEESRKHISKEVLKGIELFDKTRWTALCTDWSEMGVGYFMSQKYCTCLEITPMCCVTGWRVCMVGSSFNSLAKSNYEPIEGECLGVANALHKTQYYTQGCDKLVIRTDHKPLLGVLNDRSLDSLDNPRLIRQKEKILGMRFKIIHVGRGAVHEGGQEGDPWCYQDH